MHHEYLLLFLLSHFPSFPRNQSKLPTTMFSYIQRHYRGRMTTVFNNIFFILGNVYVLVREQSLTIKKMILREISTKVAK